MADAVGGAYQFGFAPDDSENVMLRAGFDACSATDALVLIDDGME
jgi:hypothetical protein